MILITGANGNLGRRLIAQLGAEVPIRAVVRSEQAARTIAPDRAANNDGAANLDVRVLDYLDQEAMSEAAQGCSHLVHLVGIIKESATSTFEAAHEATTRVVVEAARRARLNGVVYMSILGSRPDAANACLASKGRAEDILRQGEIPALIIRVPMVLGEGDYASRALYFRARSRIAFQFRAASLEQPIYAGDVLAAILTGLNLNSAATECSGSFDLAGPESLSRADLTQRAAEVMGVPAPLVISLPLGLGMLAAALLEKLGDRPPVTRAMLGVLNHDDRIDPGPAARSLGISLTPLKQMLRSCLVESPPA